MTDKLMQDIKNTFSCPKKCKSEFQDERYGKDLRIFTVLAEKTVGEKRCTVCGTVK